jgi:hypothetical protein
VIRVAVVVGALLAADPALAATFPGTGVGAIPDGLAGTPPQFGPPLNVTFNVSGLVGTVTSVTIDVTMTHTWVGDVDAVLMAPGGAPSLVIVSRIGVTSAGSFGDSSNYSGTYTFADSAGSAAIDNIWSKALGTNGNPACTDTCNLPSATYRTTGPGFTGQTNPPPLTSLNTTFGGLSPAAANGTWTLRLRDGGQGDTGPVTAANLTINVTVPLNGDIDANGAVDALTDGLLFLRYVFGFRGAILISGVVAGNCTRCTAPLIESYIASTFY